MPLNSIRMREFPQSLIDVTVFRDDVTRQSWHLHDATIDVLWGKYLEDVKRCNNQLNTALMTKPSGPYGAVYGVYIY
ncbi:hypothetical protein GGI35DRAFT_430439, partial [Trichoderma velutinum]